MAKKKRAVSKKSRKPAGGKSRDVLVVASKIKAYVRTKNMNTSAEAIGALSERVYALIDEATNRGKANKRKTVKAQDV